MPIYKTSGTLTGHIEPENVSAAQEYLEQDDMTKYLDGSLKEAIIHIQWRLDNDGHNYKVLAFAKRDLTDEELEALASWVSGQNSDGLGEGFEQQAWAWVEDEECEDCDNVFGSSCGNCGSMISFDWETNDSKFEMVDAP